MAYYANQPLPDTNARSPAITVRPASTALLTIDSEDRYQDYLDARENPTSPYNFTIRKNENLMAGFFTRLAVTEVNFPWTIPNINQKTNKILVSYDINGTFTALTTIVIPVGFYTPAQLAAQMQIKVRALDAGLASFVMAYGQDISLSVGISGEEPSFSYRTDISVNTISFDPLPYNTTAYPYNSQTKQLFDLLGFEDANSIQATNGIGAYTYCQAIRYVDIVCNVLTSVSALKDNTSQPVVRDMLCRVYLGDGGGTGQSTTKPSDAAFCPPGCMPLTIYRNFTNPKQIQWLPNQNIPGTLQFQVYDDAGDLLANSLADPAVAYSQATNFSFTLLVSEN
jgi:hypothetical protein